MSTKDGDLFFHEDKEINLKELAFSKGFSTLSDIGNCKLIVEGDSLLSQLTFSLDVRYTVSNL